MAANPREIRLSDTRRHLDIIWDDGTASRLAAATLRAHSRSAEAVRAGIDGLLPTLAQDIAIADVVPVGAYAVNLVFSDGHGRGIFPWPYLRALGDGAEA
ncbi:gamma-butyrobetaine hydroxylase-like domain-containing protein [Methylorubrum zatmanii]